MADEEVQTETPVVETPPVDPTEGKHFGDPTAPTVGYNAGQDPAVTPQEQPAAPSEEAAQ